MGSVKSREDDKRHNNLHSYVRRAHHAGSWYEDSPSLLDDALTNYLRKADRDVSAAAAAQPQRQEEDDEAVILRGLVVPHAGYSYSGPTAAHAYRALVAALKQQEQGMETTIVVLHPSHHVHLRNACAVSGATELATPMGNLKVDARLREEIQQLSSLFRSTMDAATDENEHSGEMQYPYIYKACQMANNNKGNIIAAVLPIMVGALDDRWEERAGTQLAPILARPNVLTIVSSDFCHWGRRFQFQPTGINGTQIFKHVEDMDRKGMNHIEMQEPGAFALYLKQTSNTICGRHAIAVWLHAIRTNREANVETLDVRFVRYAQSAPARTMNDSSVSYASAVATRSK